MVSTRNVELGLEPYVVPSQCGQVFYLQVPGRAGWSYVVRYDPRGRSVKYFVEEEDDIEDEDGIEEHLTHISLNL